MYNVNVDTLLQELLFANQELLKLLYTFKCQCDLIKILIVYGMNMWLNLNIATVCFEVFLSAKLIDDQYFNILFLKFKKQAKKWRYFQSFPERGKAK